MNPTPHSSYLLVLSWAMLWFYSCQLSTRPSNIEALEMTYQHMLSGQQNIDLDSLREIADELGRAYIAAVDADTAAETAPDYLFKAATLYESSFMNPSYALGLYNRLLKELSPK